MLTALLSWANIPISVSGQVTDASGNGVADVTVYIYTDSSFINPVGYYNSVQTDANGFYLDNFEVPDNQTQGLVIAYIECTNYLSEGQAFWNPGNTDLTIDLDYCQSNTFCSVEIQVDEVPGSTVSTLSAIPTGTAPFTYSWSTGANSQSITVTESGEYCVEVVDAEGCTTIACVIIVVGGNCSVEVVSNPASGLMAFATGMPPFTYLWDTGETTPNIFPMQPGIYCVTITDNSGCTSEACGVYGNVLDSCSVSVDLVQNGAFLQATTTGQAPYVYSWDNGATSAVIPTPASGMACVTITDATGCEATGCFNNNPQDCSVTIEQNPMSNDLWAYGSGGVAPYVYSWNTGESTQSITPIEEGEYCVTLIDAVGCSSTDCFYFGDTTDCFVNIIVTQIQGSNIYSLEAVPNGVAPFTYYWEQDGSTSSSIEVTEEGVYCVTTTDATGCSTTACAFVETLSPLDQIYGSVHLGDSSNFNLISGVVYLVVYDPVDETLTAVDMVPIDGNVIGGNSYDFGAVPAGQYLVKAAVDAGTEGYETNLPAYYTSHLFWNEADLITIPYFNPTSHDVSLIEGINPGGPGFIGGYVSEGANLSGSDDRGGLGDPVVGASVLLLNPDGSGVTHTLTDAGGYFKFPDLAWGTYQVVVEITGLDQGIKWVTIGPDQPEVTDIQFEVGATAVTTATNNILDAAGIFVSPNPVSEQLLLDINMQEAANIQLELINTVGQRLLVQSVKLGTGQTQLEIDFSNYSSGLYLIRLSDGPSMRTFKIVKQ